MRIGTAHIVWINAYVAGASSSLSHGSRKLLSVVKLPSAESGRESWPNCATELMKPYAGLIDAWATVATVGSGCPRSIDMAAGSSGEDGRSEACGHRSRRKESHAGRVGIEVAGRLSVLRREMDRETLEKNLTQAEAHVAKGHERIALQHEIIAELEREGHDTVPARELLATFEKTQAMHVANRDRIAGKLATLDYRPWPARPRP
ncbi:MAG: hypothetical protein QOJ15_5458 [Bradyrhizobium sp.]|nr:hypothetical protein [Bradyrhizobium sp.]